MGPPRLRQSRQCGGATGFGCGGRHRPELNRAAESKSRWSPSAVSCTCTGRVAISCCCTASETGWSSRSAGSGAGRRSAGASTAIAAVTAVAAVQDAFKFLKFEVLTRVKHQYSQPCQHTDPGRWQGRDA